MTQATVNRHQPPHCAWIVAQSVIPMELLGTYVAQCCSKFRCHDWRSCPPSLPVQWTLAHVRYASSTALTKRARYGRHANSWPPSALFSCILCCSPWDYFYPVTGLLRIHHSIPFFCRYLSGPNVVLVEQRMTIVSWRKTLPPVSKILLWIRRTSVMMDNIWLRLRTITSCAYGNFQVE